MTGPKGPGGGGRLKSQAVGDQAGLLGLKSWSGEGEAPPLFSYICTRKYSEWLYIRRCQVDWISWNLQLDERLGSSQFMNWFVHLMNTEERNLVEVTFLEI